MKKTKLALIYSIIAIGLLTVCGMSTSCSSEENDIPTYEMKKSTSPFDEIGKSHNYILSQLGDMFSAELNQFAQLENTTSADRVDMCNLLLGNLDHAIE